MPSDIHWWPRVTKSRLIASAIGALSVGAGLIREELQPILFAAGSPFMPLAVIWLADPLSNATGLVPSQWVVISRRSPAIAIEVLGWLMLIGIPAGVALSRS